METASKPCDQQATNNALAALAAVGNSAALAQLWELNKGLIRSIYWKWYPAHKDLAQAHGLTVEDFEQEGFFAVVNAAKTYDQTKGAFTTWLAASMNKQIQLVWTGGHRRNVEGNEGKSYTTSADLLNHCISLDLPIDDEDGGSATIGDIQEDPAAAAEFEAAEDALFQDQLRAAVDEALAKLADREADVMHRRYYLQQPLEEVGKAYGVTWSRARQIEKEAMRKLRRDPKLCRFHDEVVQHHAYKGTSFRSWNHGGSVEEHIVEYLESKGAYLYEVR